jgi:hypothetical protein
MERAPAWRLFLCGMGEPFHMMIDRRVKGLGVWPVCSRRQPPLRPCISVDKTNPYSSHALAATAERVAYSNYTTATAQVLCRRMDRDVTGRGIFPQSPVEANGIASA